MGKVTQEARRRTEQIRQALIEGARRGTKHGFRTALAKRFGVSKQRVSNIAGKIGLNRKDRVKEYVEHETERRQADEGDVAKLQETLGKDRGDA